MNDASLLRIPVRVCADDGHTLILLPVNRAEDCAACAAGHGCGESPWFRGFFGERPLRLPRPPELPQQISYLELCLPAADLNRITSRLYGLPLLTFFAALFLCTALPSWLGFSLALSGALLTFLIGRKKHKKQLEEALLAAVPGRIPSRLV